MKTKFLLLTALCILIFSSVSNKGTAATSERTPVLQQKQEITQAPKDTIIVRSEDKIDTPEPTIEPIKSTPEPQQTTKDESKSEPVITNQAHQNTISNQLEDTKTYGPTSKGTQLLGGSASYRKNNGTYFLTINPNRGTFVADNFAIGFNHLYRARFKSYSDFNSFGPYLKFYAGGSDKGKVFAQVGGTIGVFDLKFDNITLGYNVRGGYALFINNSIALEFSADYNKTENRDGDLGFNIGFQIHYNKNSK